MSCRELLGRDDAYDQGGVPACCATCSLAAINDDAIVAFERSIAIENFERADAIALDLAANPSTNLNPPFRQMWNAWR